MNTESVCCDEHRRHFLQGSMGVTIAALGAGAMIRGASAASLSEAQRNAMTPDQVIKSMLDGNVRFLSGTRKERDYLAEMRTSSAGEYPAAVVLSCVDSRAPVEIICDLGLGDTFNARVAGNAVNDDILGSMEFACAAAGAKAVVVMVIRPAVRLKARSTMSSWAISRSCWLASSQRLTRPCLTAHVPPRTQRSSTPSRAPTSSSRSRSFDSEARCSPPWKRRVELKSWARCTTLRRERSHWFDRIAVRAPRFTHSSCPRSCPSSRRCTSNSGRVPLHAQDNGPINERRA